MEQKLLKSELQIKKAETQIEKLQEQLSHSLSKPGHQLGSTPENSNIAKKVSTELSSSESDLEKKHQMKQQIANLTE